jgi:putative flippase GtrA
MNFIKYFIVGGAAALVDLGGFLWLTSSLRIQWFAAACTSFTLATLVNYILSITFVFRSGVRFRRHQEVALVFLVSLVGLACNQIVLGLMIVQVGLPKVEAKLAATSAVFIWNYMARKHLVFSSAGQGRRLSGLQLDRETEVDADQQA